MTLDVDRKAQGVPAQFAEPPAAARAALPALAKQFAKRDDVQSRQTQLWGEVAQLQASLHADRQRDRIAYAAAAEAGVPAQPSIAEATERLITEKRSLAIALVDKIDQEQHRAHEIIMRERDKWTRDIEHRLVEHIGHYAAAVDEAERARQVAVDDVTAKWWLEHYPEPAPMPQTAFVRQPDVLRDQPKRSAAQHFEDLRRDAEALSNTAGVVVDTRRALALYNHGAGFQTTSGRKWIR